MEWLQTRQDFRNRQTVRASFAALPTRKERFLNAGPGTYTLSQDAANVVQAYMETGGAVATVDGTFTGQPAPGDVISIDASASTGYTFVTALDNTSVAEVLIGATTADSLQNLIDAINRNPATAGIGYSLPTVWGGVGPASVPTGLTFTLSFQVAGIIGNSQTVSATSANFSWSSGSMSGGVDPTALTILDSSNDYSWTVGLADFELALSSGGTWLTVEYYSMGSDCIAVEDTSLVTARAAIEHGTGKYQQLEDDSQLADIVTAYNRALGNLNAFKTLPVTFSFQTDSPLLSPGQFLTINLIKPTGSPALVNGDYVVQEVDGHLIPGMAQSTEPGGGHFRYTISVINATQIGTYVKFWEQLALASSTSASSVGAGSGSGAGTVVSPWGAEEFASASGTVTPDGSLTYHVIDCAGTVAVDTTVGSVPGQPHTFKVTCNGNAATFDAAYLGMVDPLIVLDTRAGYYNILTFTTDIGTTTFSLTSFLLGVS